MKPKRTSQRSDTNESSKSKKQKYITKDDYFMTLLEECGLKINTSPDKCVTLHETHVIVRNLKNNLQKHQKYPSNVSEFISNFQSRCKDKDLTEFKHYLFPNIIRNPSESCVDSSVLSDSLVKILLRVPILQNKLIDFIFGVATDLAAESKCGPWIRMILKCLSMLDNIVDSDKISSNLIDLFDVATEDMVRLEIITAIPDIIGDTTHDCIAAGMIRFLGEHCDLVPAILDCLSYLCLSNEQYKHLQKKTLNILNTSTKCNNFASFVKFLLIPGRTNESTYLEVVKGLRNALCWSTSIDKPEETVTSQILTANAIRNSMISSKIIANAWLKAVSLNNLNIDYKPINFIVIIILYSSSDKKEKQLENVTRTLIKNNTLNEELLDKVFEDFKPIIRDNVKYLISLTNSLLKVQGDPLIHNFASYIYTLMFSKLEDYGQTIVAELLQLSLDYKQCVQIILSILNRVAQKDMSILKPQSVQMLTLLDRMDDMALTEIRAVMNLVCGLAYNCENSFIRDDIHIIITKELASSNSTIKIQGILAGLHAVKFLMMSKDGEDQPIDDKNNHMEGDLREAADIIQLINNSTRHHPDMTAFFYDEFCEILSASSYINKHFLNWLTDTVTVDLYQNFTVENINREIINGLKLDIQFPLNTNVELNEVLAINIGGTSSEVEGVNIRVLSPLLQLVQTLHMKKYEDLTKIDALLRCPMVMPVFEIDTIDDMNSSVVSFILDCLLHCCNWFRELVNAFSFQNDFLQRSMIFNRVSQLRKLENIISQILLQISFNYKPPVQGLSLNASNNDHFRKNMAKKQTVQRKNTKRTQEDALLSETIQSQLNHVVNNNIVIKNKLGCIQNITFRPLSLNILNLLSVKLAEEDDEEGLSVDNLIFLLKCVNCNLENVLISRVKKSTFLTKQINTEPYNSTKAKECVLSMKRILPTLIELVESITSHLDKSSDNKDKTLKFSLCLEYIYNILTIYFKWIGFKAQNKSLLADSLRSITRLDNKNCMFIKKVILTVVEYFQKHEKYCTQMSTAVSLVEIVSALHEHSSQEDVTKILRDMAQRFLSQEWRNATGVTEKGITYNQSIDNLLRVYFLNVDIPQLKNIVLMLIGDIQILKRPNITLSSFKSINKTNLPILYKNLGNALVESIKTFQTKQLTNLNHLELWFDVVFILKSMSDLTKSLKVRTIHIAYFKMSLPIIKLFLSQGIPILELEFKTRKKYIQEILNTLQKSTRFLQILCHHFKTTEEKAILGKVPYMKQLLESLICKVKSSLAANGSSGELWLGVLKNKNIEGDVIPSQESIESTDSTEDHDEQLGEGDSDDDDSNEIFDSDSKSVSDIL